MHHKSGMIVLCAISLAAPVLAYAQEPNDIFKNGTVDGEFRAYGFNSTPSSPDTFNRNEFASGILLNAQTGRFGDGFTLAASLLGGSTLGTLSNNPAKRQPTLLGERGSVAAISQAYLQYSTGSVIAKVGNMYLDTPWMGKSDGVLLPASYQGAMVTFLPDTNWRIYAIHVSAWKSRTSSSYYKDNVYYSSTYHGDNMYANVGGLPQNVRSAPGTTAVGARYGTGDVKGQAWFYDFKGFARMAYVDGNFEFKTGVGVDPFVAAQYMTETGGPSNILVENGYSRFGFDSGDRVRSQAWGVKIGVNMSNSVFDIEYNEVAHEKGAIGSGAVISPYTDGYAFAPFYTTEVIWGLDALGPGHALGGYFSHSFLDGRLTTYIHYVKYTTLLFGTSYSLHLDTTYKLDNWLKGLSVRYRWERSRGGIGLNPGDEPLTFNRLQLAYDF